MKPETAIAPTLVVRRRTAKRWHLLGEVPGFREPYETTLCGQRIPALSAVVRRSYNAAEIDTACLVEAIRHPERRRLA